MELSQCANQPAVNNFAAYFPESFQSGTTEQRVDTLSDIGNIGSYLVQVQRLRLGAAAVEAGTRNCGQSV
jgi:hypothetical protein